MRLIYIAAITCVFTLPPADLVRAQSTPQQLIPPGRNGTPVQQATAPKSTALMQPEWFPLDKSQQQYIDQLLDHWQTTSNQIRQYKCEFTRYDYDTRYCNWRDPRNNQLAAVSIMTGEIRFAAPDKASYETLRVFDFTSPPKQEGQDAVYTPRDGVTNREKWVCDGKAIFEFDYNNKKLYETTIPPEMQGKGLVHSPIPFLFGANKEDILKRFWVRIVTPQGVKNEYWLEAVPKKIDDARNYKKLELSISAEDFLPVMLHVYAPNYDPQHNNLTSRIFEFKNRRVNNALSGIQNFFNRFVRPSTPIGWQRVNRKSLDNQQFDPTKLNRPAQQPGATRFK